MKFSKMNLSEETLRAIADLAYKEPTPVQEEAISAMLNGYDMIVQSQTGTGKTAAFSIPIIERTEPLDRSLQAVVLCPTRELCMQSADEIRKLLKYHDSIRVLPLYGGQPIDRQIQALRGGVQIIAATPGRFMDHMNRHTIRLSSVHTVVLDEADEMLNMGFRDDMEAILDKMPKERQTVLFSATMPDAIVELAARYLHEPKRVHSGPASLTVQAIEEVWYDLKEKMKPEALSRLLEMERPERCLVFCNTKKRVDELHARLKAMEIPSSALHGDLNQQQRDIVMRQFRSGESRLLIATDVAARGIDVENIDLVINYDVPDHEEYYVHRIGRTGRAGKAGKACTFVVGRETERLKAITEYTGHEIKAGRLPTLSDLESHRTAFFLEQIREQIDQNALDHSLDHSLRIVDRLEREGYSASDVAAVLIRQQLGMQDERIDDLNAPSRLPETDYTAFPKETLVFNIGSKRKVRAKDIVGAIAGETGIPGHALGQIRIEEAQTFVEVPKPLVRDLLTVMQGASIKGYAVSVCREGASFPEPAGRRKPRRR